MKLNRKLMLILAVVLSVAMAAGGTMAYLQDTDEDVNVMTLGNVYINQLEYERVPTEGHELTNDAWVSTGETDKYGYTPDEVRPFTQAKPLYPAVFADGIIKWDDRNGSQAASGEGSHQQSWGGVKGEKTTGAPGSYQLFDDSVKNVIDKFVFVENTGSSDAYVRTWIALEQGSVAANDFASVIMTNTDKDHWDWETVATDVEIEGNKYVLKVATYKGPTSNPTGILAAGSISYVSLAQVYMRPEATNDDVIAIDGNQNGTYDILVVSQAVQAEGFENGAVALNDAFGEAGEDNHPWTEGNLPGPNIGWPGFIMNGQEAYESSLTVGEYTLGDDIKTSDAENHYSGNREYAITGAREYTLNLNGHAIMHDGSYQDGKNTGYTYLYTTVYNGKLTINGEGEIWSENPEGNCCIVYAQGPSEVVINGGDFRATRGIPVWAGNNSKVTINGGTFISFEGNNNEEMIYSSGGVIDIYGGFFHNTGWESRPVNVANANRGTGFINIYGGTFVNFDPSTGGDDPNNIRVMEGYTVVSETQDNGDVWYTVVKK